MAQIPHADCRPHRGAGRNRVVLLSACPLFGAVGLSALTGYLDYMLRPAIAIFVALGFHALIRKKAI